MANLKTNVVPPHSPYLPVLPEAEFPHIKLRPPHTLITDKASDCCSVRTRSRVMACSGAVEAPVISITICDWPVCTWI